FVYDSKKSGAITISHLRSSPRPIRSAYLIDRAGFVACHQFEFIDNIDVLEYAAPGAVFLLNAPGEPAGVWDRLPRELQHRSSRSRSVFLRSTLTRSRSKRVWVVASTRSCRPA